MEKTDLYEGLDVGSMTEPEINEIADTITRGLSRGEVVEVDYQPGNMTCYRLVFATLDDGFTLVSWVNARWCHAFDLDPQRGLLHWSYVEKKMATSVGSRADAAAIARLLTAVRR